MGSPRTEKWTYFVRKLKYSFKLCSVYAGSLTSTATLTHATARHAVLILLELYYLCPYWKYETFDTPDQALSTGVIEQAAGNTGAVAFYRAVH